MLLVQCPQLGGKRTSRLAKVCEHTSARRGLIRNTGTLCDRHRFHANLNPHRYFCSISLFEIDGQFRGGQPAEIDAPATVAPSGSKKLTGSDHLTALRRRLEFNFVAIGRSCAAVCLEQNCTSCAIRRRNSGDPISTDFTGQVAASQHQQRREYDGSAHLLIIPALPNVGNRVVSGQSPLLRFSPHFRYNIVGPVEVNRLVRRGRGF